MTEEESFNKHSATQSTGFDYQFYYFIYYTLRMENEDDVVGYEKKDDVHIELKGEKIELCQIKHSNDKSPLTDSSVDLWNTLATWADVLAESSTPEIYSFAFVTNRPNNSDFIKQIIDFKVNYKSNFEDIKNSIQKLYNLTISRKKKKDKESENEKHQKTVINLDEKLFKMLFNNISFEGNKINVITGDGTKGKSSVVQIIDYCLGANASGISNDIEDKVSWFGIKLSVNNKDIAIARKSSNNRECYFNENGILPEEEPQKNQQEISKFLSAEFGLIPTSLTDFKIICTIQNRIEPIQWKFIYWQLE